MKSNHTEFSKFLSLVLRHRPETIGITLDENGWTDVSMLLEKMNGHGIAIDADLLNDIVANNPKKRFAFDESGRNIRASQGHSVEINLGYERRQPPQLLYHGTPVSNLPSVLKSGLEKRSRHHVHLSVDEQTAVIVGRRHGKPVVLSIEAGKMHDAGYAFFLSENGVWLTDHVPSGYLTPMYEESSQQ